MNTIRVFALILFLALTFILSGCGGGGSSSSDTDNGMDPGSVTCPPPLPPPGPNRLPSTGAEWKPLLQARKVVGDPTPHIASGDFNNDGHVDLITGSHVYLSDGSGSFQKLNEQDSKYPGGGFTIVNDVNRDGNLDLINISGVITILLGNGDGSFQSSASYSVASDWAESTNLTSSAVADINGDTVLDLIVTKYDYALEFGQPPVFNGSVQVLLGHGDGTFSDAVSYHSWGKPSSVAIGDFNEDCLYDLVVTDSQLKTLSFFFGTGSGSFTEPVAYTLNEEPSSVAVGDFDGDDHLDLVVVEYASDTQSVWFGRGDGSFRKTPLNIAVSSLIGLKARDLDGDGNLDLITNSSSTISIYKGRSDGSFSEAGNYRAYDIKSIEIDDINNDGILDIIAAHASAQIRRRTRENISILIGRGDAEFYSLTDFNINSVGLTIGDFNNDSYLDFALAEDPNRGAVLLNDGQGNLIENANFEAGEGAHEIANRDFNGDGNLDLVIAASESNEVRILLGDGRGRFVMGSILTVAGDHPNSMVISDFNQDAKVDIAVVSSVNTSGELSESGENGKLTILFGEGDGTFAERVEYTMGVNPTSIIVGDLNDDDILDLVVGNQDDYNWNFSIFLGSFNGAFSPEIEYSLDFRYTSMAIGDVNNDGILDLVLGHTHGFALGTLDPGISTDIYVLLGQGDGSFVKHVGYGEIVYPEYFISALQVALSDINNDGNLDILLPGLYVFLGSGDGSFPTIKRFSGGGYNVAAEDMNNDGNLDVIGWGGGTYIAFGNSQNRQ